MPEAPRVPPKDNSEAISLEGHAGNHSKSSPLQIAPHGSSTPQPTRSFQSRTSVNAVSQTSHLDPSKNDRAVESLTQDTQKSLLPDTSALSPAALDPAAPMRNSGLQPKDEYMDVDPKETLMTSDVRRDPNHDPSMRPRGSISRGSRTSPSARKPRSHSSQSARSATSAEAEDEDAFSTESAELRFDEQLREEMPRTWILTLSMHFRDSTRREKFFVTYMRAPNKWLRVSVSVDYSRPKVRPPMTPEGSDKMDVESKSTLEVPNKQRSQSRHSPKSSPPRNEADRLPPEAGSLEEDLTTLTYQRDKNFCIFKAVYHSLDEIRFFNTITNLKLETIDERLHIHVAEDANERIQYPPVSNLYHLNFSQYGYLVVDESEVIFDAHLSGFVYRVSVRGKTCVKKEITSIDTVQEFIYEIEALAKLRQSPFVVNLVGIVRGGSADNPLIVGVLLEWARGGALNDFFYDNEDRDLTWNTKMTWIRQVVQGMSDIHEAGYVQGDCTLSNIVLDADENAKIVDINRRGCPIGWEPPEFRGMIQSGQRISMFIGVKSDLYQMGMVIWAIANQIEEPDRADRPLLLDEDAPPELKAVLDSCLADDPVDRRSASELLTVLKPFQEYNRRPMTIKDLSAMPTAEEINASRKRFFSRRSRGGSELSDIKDHFKPAPAQQRPEAMPSDFAGLMGVHDDLDPMAGMQLMDISGLEEPVRPENVFKTSIAPYFRPHERERADMMVNDREEGSLVARSDPVADTWEAHEPMHVDSGLGDDMKGRRRKKDLHPGKLTKTDTGIDVAEPLGSEELPYHSQY